MKTPNKKTKIEKRREESIKGYIDELQDKYSKINAIRVDLAYKKPYSKDITASQANEDINKMLSNRRTKPSIFKDNIGYVVKKEYTKAKGVHLHALFLYDGQKVQKDVHKATQIGKYWNENITKEKGSYHNCNKNKYPNSAIGMIDYKDKDKRKSLDENVIPYLCKDKQNIVKDETSSKDKSFIRGTVKKKKKTSGRPRSKKELIKDETKS